MLALIYQANKSTIFAVETPNGTTRSKIVGEVLQEDVLAPLTSSNMVEKPIGAQAMVSNHVYLYKKNIIIIPPLTMKDDTLGVIECGFKLRKMNSFLNTRAQIMGLQFGSENYEKMHTGKKHVNPNICTDLKYTFRTRPGDLVMPDPIG